EHGSVSSTMSFGEYPFCNAAASVITFQVEPGWRPIGWVAMLYWLSEKSGPPTIARTAPVVGSIATRDAFQSGPFCGFFASTAFCAAACMFGSKVVYTF